MNGEIEQVHPTTAQGAICYSFPTPQCVLLGIKKQKNKKNPHSNNDNQFRCLEASREYDGTDDDPIEQGIWCNQEGIQRNQLHNFEIIPYGRMTFLSLSTTLEGVIHCGPLGRS